MNSNWIGFKTLIRRELLRMFSIPAQTIFPPIISSVLFILIFGFFMGTNLPSVAGVDFKAFFIPGLIMMNVIITAYSNTAFSLYLKRFLEDINDLLVTPLSYTELVLGFVFGGTIRATFIGVIIYCVGALMTPLPMYNLPLFLFFTIGASILFSAMGIVVGLWAEDFDQVEIFTVFLLTPLTFLGGVFHSVKLLPEFLQQLSALNSLFYLIDGLRYSVIGQAEGNILIAMAIVIVLCTGLLYWDMHLFKKGWKLRT